MLPRVKVGAEPVRPDASCPCVGVERAQSKNTPLLRAPRRVKPKWLTKHPEDARPAAPAFTLVLRKPDRNNAAKGNANLIYAQSPLPEPATGEKRDVWWLVPASVINHTERGAYASHWHTTMLRAAEFQVVVPARR